MTKIEWAEKTWNPIVGCTKVSPGCAHCYAERQSARLGRMVPTARVSGRSAHRMKLYQAVVNGEGQFNGQTRFDEQELTTPLHWKKPRRIFVCSMSDLFRWNNSSEWMAAVFAIIARCPQHTFIVLTKRPQRMAAHFWGLRGRVESMLADLPPRYGQSGQGCWPLRNAWLGTSAEDQQRLDERLPHLLACPAAVRFLSLEPLLAPVVIPPQCLTPDGINWVLVGGESGPGARPNNVAWVRALRAQCKAAGVAFFNKQLGRRFAVANDPLAWEHEWPNGGDDLIDVEPERPGLCQGDEVLVRTRHPKGADPAEWPADLRVREYPTDLRAGGQNTNPGARGGSTPLPPKSAPAGRSTGDE